MFKMSLVAAVLAAGFVSAASAATVNFSATMNGAQEVPPKQTSGSGDVLATLDTATKQLHYTVSWFGLSGPATAAHFHGPAKPGANAGVLIPIGGKGPTSPQTGTATLTDDQVKMLMSGMMYANVHTAANPAGEIRGQMMTGSGAHAMPMNKAPAAAPAKKP